MEKLNPRMITLARESRQMVLADLGEKMGLSAQSIRNMEQSQQNIKQATLDTLSNALGYPVSFFFQQGENVPLPFSYRKRGTVPFQLLDAIDAQVNIFRLNLEKLITATGFSVQSLPVLDVTKLGSPADCAKQLRKQWNLKPGPINDLAELLENHNILLASYDFGTDEVDSKCTIAADEFPMIVTNKTLLGDRQRFTLAYQLGFLVMHWKTFPDFERKLEREAKEFASAFLMPEEEIKEELTDLKFSQLPGLKTKWKASMISLVHRSDDLGVIDENRKNNIIKQFGVHGIKFREPKEYDVQVEKYKLIRDLITKYKKAQKLNVKQMAEFFCLNEEDFLKRYNF